MQLSQYERAHPAAARAAAARRDGGGVLGLAGSLRGGGGGAASNEGSSSQRSGGHSPSGSVRLGATASLVSFQHQQQAPPPTLSKEERDEAVRRGRATRLIRPFLELLVRDTDANRPNVSLMSALLTDSLPADFATIIRDDNLLADAAVDGSVSYFDAFLGCPASAWRGAAPLRS